MAVIRRQTAQVKAFERPGAEAVIYDLSNAGCVTITLPIASRWTSQPHWHENHTEFLQILQGRAFVRLGYRAGVYGPEDGVIEVPKYTVHEWHRALGEGEQEDLVVREWTMPEDGQKEIFFRNLNSFLMEPQPNSMYELSALLPQWVKTWIEGWIIPLQLFCIFRASDNWPLLVGDNSGLISWVATHMVLAICSAIGAVLGLRGTYDQYVSNELLSKARGGKASKKTS